MIDDELHNRRHVAAAVTIRSSLYEIEKEASRGPIDRKLRAFYHKLLATLGEIENRIERRKLDDGP